jgi:hypothetical protein
MDVRRAMTWYDERRIYQSMRHVKGSLAPFKEDNGDVALRSSVPSISAVITCPPVFAFDQSASRQHHSLKLRLPP